MERSFRRIRNKLLGIVLPVVISQALCLTVPFILLAANAFVLAGAIIAYISQRNQLATKPGLGG